MRSLVVSQAVQLAAIGVALGLALAWLLTPLMATQLYGIQPGDPLTFAAVSAILLLVALTAALVPARRAMRVDPATALRAE